MRAAKEKRRIRWLQLFTLLGAFYCLTNAFGVELFCGTRGCDIYAGYGLFGISFYWYGFSGFIALLLLTFFSRMHFFRLHLSLALGLALLLDSLFLLYQSLLWPCSSCHLVALLIGIVAFIGIRHLNLPGSKILLGVGMVWGIFFIYVSIAVVKELAFTPWPLYGSSDAPVKVYFSPTCPACEDVVRQLLDNQQTSEQAALYPVAKNRQDEVRLASILSQPHRTLEASDILKLFSEAEVAGLSLDITSRIRLLSNMMFLARSDAKKVPLIISPYLLTTAARQEASFSLPFQSPWDTPAGIRDDSGCSVAVSGETCDE